MNDSESRRQEIMRDLAMRFKSSSEVMRLIAKRISEAAQSHSVNHHRLEKAESTLRKSVDPQSVALPFSYREFVEFTSAAEFEHFRAMDPITDEELKNIDWDQLADGLLGRS